MRADPMRYEIYRDTDGEWRWRHVTADGEVIAVAGVGYENEADCMAAILIIKGSSDVPVVVR